MLHLFMANFKSIDGLVMDMANSVLVSLGWFPLKIEKKEQ